MAHNGPLSNANKQQGSRSIKLPSTLNWIPMNWTWSKWKPVIRSALTAWISLVIFIIPQTETILGQASFLILIAAFLSPPSDPFIAVLEREFIILIFVGLGWALVLTWTCLALKLADLARSQNIPDAPLTSIIAGEYLEVGPSAILVVFMFIGSVFFLYIKARLGPGPFLFASIFGCICIDISLIAAALFPYPYYAVGQTIMLPLVFHSAIALLLSILMFPSSISALYTVRLQAVLSPLTSAVKQHREQLQEDMTSPSFSASSIIAAVDKAEGALPMLAAAARLLKLDIIYCRFAPTDYHEMHDLTRRLTVRANGMDVYYTLIDPTRERFPLTPVPSVPATPTMTSPVHSRQQSPAPSIGREEGHGDQAGVERRKHHARHRRTPSRKRHGHHSGAHSHKRQHSTTYKHSASHHSHHNLLHSSLLHLALSRTPKTEFAVGVFESQRYLNLEATHLSHPESARYTQRATELLSTSCQDLLRCCELALQNSSDWLGCTRDHRFKIWVCSEEKQKRRKDNIKKFEDLHRDLSVALDEFIRKKRLSVLDPYRSLFNPNDDASDDDDVPPHRYLFNCYVYQYHLMRFAMLLQSLLGEIVRLEKERTYPRLWVPSMDFSKLAFWSVWEPSEILEKDDDEDPDMIPGIDPQTMMDLGRAVRRDPDALPPRNILETVMNCLYRMVVGVGGGNMLYATKAGVLTVILSIPSFVKSTAHFAYNSKFVWAVFMGQLTIARFRGDTTFGLVARIISTFVGGIMGTIMWYISAGSGEGNPYGLAAVCAVCFPFFFFARLYWPVPPMTNLIIFVTTALVIGYSYQDTHLLTPTSPGWGFDVAWKRFLLVTIGVIAAGIFSFFPPSTTIRSYQRRTLATTTAELGAIYCSAVSFANTRREDTTSIVQSLIAIRSKLKRSIVLKENVIYEFSLRGKWPAERYQKILEIQLQIAYLLSHLMSVIDRLEPAWAQAFLKRTRMLDADFQGDVLAVISLISSSLRTGQPLPQVTPCPLLDRFMSRFHGLNVIHEESEDDFGLPKTLTLETLESLQYLTFCVGVSTAFGIVTRLDRLMVAVKELVGEQYHIHGVGLPLYRGRSYGVEMRSPTISIRPVQDV
ncbi:hypothetical protein F5I97DRAFT_1806524 [Phlebopus sp. FC_14]|nr:hypothetical protein F5I97DRAFT_1806524 [Phlebopus sp. FC_14]